MFGKISDPKTVRIKFPVGSQFSNMLYGKRNENLETPEITKNFLNQKAPSVNGLPSLEKC